MKLTKTQLAWLLSDLITEMLAGHTSGNQDRAFERSGNHMSEDDGQALGGYSNTDCPSGQFYVCGRETSMERCGVEGSPDSFDCGSKGPIFECRSRDVENGRYQFECADESKFECSSKMFTCTGRFQCAHGGDYTCATTQDIDGSDLFQCNNQVKPLAFECVHNTSDFDCTGAELYDFNCNRVPQGIPDAFNCPANDQPPMFECTALHIFGCFEKFNCPGSHTCNSPTTASTCDDEHPWQPGSDGRDDGNPGDFDCCVFTCGASQPNGEEKFDCTTESDFKCLDGTEVSEGRFQCGLGSEFECGEEQERFVCMNYRCEDSFRCESAFHCGNKEKGREYECSFPNFQCRQVTPNPAEDGYACDDEAGGFTCEVYNCDQEGYECNPPNEFAGCSEEYKVPEPWP